MVVVMSMVPVRMMLMVALAVLMLMMPVPVPVPMLLELPVLRTFAVGKLLRPVAAVEEGGHVLHGGRGHREVARLRGSAQRAA